MSNLIKSWKTTLIGAVVITAAVASVFLAEGINWMDASIGIGIGLALLFAPDTVLSRVGELFGRKQDNEPQ